MTIDEQMEEQTLTGTLDWSDPDVMGAFLSRKLPASDRSRITRDLAQDPEARELMLMSYRALKTTKDQSGR